VTRDGGKTWKNVTPPDMGEFNRISLMEASPHDPGGAYVAAKRYQLDDRRPYVFKTHDYGSTWTKIVSGIPENDYAQAVREDPVRRGLLYLGTEHGIYVSFDDGANWQSLSLNLPDTQVADIAVERNDLVIATHGRSFYVLDNIEILRQFTDQVAGSKAYLFAPAPVIRPLRPAVIDYYLPEPASKVAIEILDPRGQAVRSFESGAAPRPADSGDPEDSGSQPSAAGGPPARAGANRFTWDLRYPGPVTFPGIVLRYAVPSQGPMAPPGEYTVRLIANGVTQTQPLTIRRDPRLTSIGDADLQEQFKLAMSIRDETSRAHEAVIRIRSLKTQMEKRSAEAGDSGISQRAALVESKLDEIEGDLYQVKNRSPRDTLNYPIKLNNQLAVLQHLVDTGDALPTDQDYAVFRELTERLDAILSRLDNAIAKDLKEFNDQLAARKLAPVK
jgi:hypothetical protein